MLGVFSTKVANPTPIKEMIEKVTKNPCEREREREKEGEREEERNKKRVSICGKEGKIIIIIIIIIMK